jgi:hypothetical protein
MAGDNADAVFDGPELGFNDCQLEVVDNDVLVVGTSTEVNNDVLVVKPATEVNNLAKVVVSFPCEDVIVISGPRTIQLPLKYSSLGGSGSMYNQHINGSVQSRVVLDCKLGEYVRLRTMLAFWEIPRFIVSFYRYANCAGHFGVLQSTGPHPRISHALLVSHSHSRMTVSKMLMESSSEPSPGGYMNEAGICAATKLIRYVNI